MFETIEKIPNLRQLDKVIAEINDYLDQAVDQDPLSILDADHVGPAPIKFWIAGGAITSAITGEKINDYDIFSPTPDLLRERLKEAVGFTSFETDHFANFWINDKKIQVISRYGPIDQQAIFNTFDFTIVCGAYDGVTFACHDRFWQDIAARRLVVNELTFPLKTLERIAKYAKRGYFACPVGLLKLARTLNEMTIDWDNPNENLLSFYEDGTPRFTGVD